MRVLVTRPSPGAERTADRLTAMGHEPVVAPLLAIRATGEPVPGAADALVVTSAQAVPAMGGLDRDLPVLAVGARTAQTLREAGFRDVRAGPGAAAGLARLAAADLPRGIRLLHVAGRDRKAEPAASLAAAGFRVAVWEAYEAAAAARLPEPAREALARHTLDTILHFSRRTATLLLSLAGEEGLGPALRAPRHLCLSEDVAAPLRAAGLDPVAAARPDEDALLAALDERSSREPGRA